MRKKLLLLKTALSLLLIIYGATIAPAQDIDRVYKQIDPLSIKRDTLRVLDPLEIGNIEIEYEDDLQNPGILPTPIGGEGERTGGSSPFSQRTPGPNAAALIRSVNNPVNLAIGSVEMEVPLYTLDAGSIQIPIKINYQGTGILAAQRATNVGLGWTFSAGGQVTRIVKGFPDEQVGISSHKSEGWCNGWPFTDDRSVYEWGAYDFWSRNSHYAQNGQLDNEPDVFYFEIPGRSGMFIFDHNRNALTIPYQNIHIEWSYSYGFTITDEDGTVYKFGDSLDCQETTRTEFPNDNIRNTKIETIECVTTWHLSSIKTLKEDEIRYSYTTGSTIEYTDFERSYKVKDFSNSNGTYNLTTKNENINYKILDPKYLKQIVYPKNNITILFDINRRVAIFPYPYSNTDYSSQYYQIHIQSNTGITTTLQTICLTYASFQNGEAKLTRIDKTANNIRENLCSFEYYNEHEDLPNPREFTDQKDLWGYWTHSEMKHGLRSSYYFWRKKYARDSNFRVARLDNPSAYHPSAFGQSYDFYPLPHFSSTGYIHQTQDYILGQPWENPIDDNYFQDSRYDYDSFYGDRLENQGELPWSIPGSDRQTPSLEGTKTYSLKRITYPTGGHVEYIYELNVISHKGATPRGANKSYKVGGLRINSIIRSTGNEEVTTKYVYHNGVPIRDVRDEYFYSAFWDDKWMFNAFSTPIISTSDMAGNHVIYPKVEVINMDGSKTIHEFSTPATSVYTCDDRPTYAFMQSKYTFSTGRVKEKNARHERIRARIYGFGPQYEKLNSRYWLRGLPMKETEIDPSGNIVSKKEYSYLVGKPMGFVEAYKLIYVYGCRALMVFQYVSQSVSPKETKITFQKYGPTQKTTYTYTADYRPREIITTVFDSEKMQHDPETFTQRIKYSNEYGVPTTLEGEGGGIKTLIDRKIVVPIEVLKIKNNKVVSAEISSYQSIIKGGQRTPVPYATYELYTEAGIPIESFTNSHLTGSSLSVHPQYELVSYISDYDTGYNQTHIVNVSGNNKAFVYENRSSPALPIAEVIVPYGKQHVYHTSFEGKQFPGITANNNAKTGCQVNYGEYYIRLIGFTPGSYDLTYWMSQDNGATWEKKSEIVSILPSGYSLIIGGPYYIDEVRLVPRGAIIKTFTYHSLFGKTSETDHNGVTKHWVYDDLGRIIKELDNDRNTIKKYEYQTKY